MKAEIAMKRVVYELSGMDEVNVRRGIEYGAHGLTMDLYLPRSSEARKPAVVIALGYPDAGVTTPFGCQFREMGMFISWAQLFAASGMAGILYETRNPADDAHEVLSYLRRDAAALGIEETRIAVWASSGHVPVALSLLIEGNLRCGVLCYGFTLDLDGATSVAKSVAQYRFANPTAGRRAEDLPNHTALFIARAGQDQFAGLNEALDRFVIAGLGCNLPLTVVNHASGPHGFDFADHSEGSREVIRSILAFLRSKLVT